MAIVPMQDAVSGEPASSSEYNRVTANVRDLNGRLVTVEGRTTHTSTGNTTLGNRLTVVEDRTTAASSGNADLATRVAALESSSGATPPFFHGYTSASQSVGPGGWTPMALTQETIDNTSGHSGATNSSRYAPGVLGWYECIGVIRWTEPPAITSANLFNGMRAGRFQLNGNAVVSAPYVSMDAGGDTTANLEPALVVFGMIRITTASDFIELAALSSVTHSTAAGSSMRCRWVSA